MSQSVLVGVAGAVVGLAGVSDHADGGGEHDEEVEGLVECGFVEVPGAVDFGSDGFGVCGEGHGFEYFVLNRYQL